jgi:hypothetical protein
MADYLAYTTMNEDKKPQQGRKIQCRESVIEHILLRPHRIGVNQVFGIAGDFACSMNDAIYGFGGA